MFRASLLLLFAACESSLPQLDNDPELALRVAPAIVESLDAEQRQRLADQLEARRQDPEMNPSRSRLGGGSCDQLVVNSQKEEGGPRLLVGQLLPSESGWNYLPLCGDVGDAPEHPLPRSQSFSTSELAALTGRAGAVVEQLLHSTEARELIRVERAAFAAVACGDRVYVNAGWLALRTDPTRGVVHLLDGPPRSASQEQSRRMAEQRLGAQTAAPPRSATLENADPAPSPMSYEQCESDKNFHNNLNKCSDACVTACDLSVSKPWDGGTTESGNGGAHDVISSRTVALPLPLGACAWLLMPIGFVFNRSRRRWS